MIERLPASYQRVGEIVKILRDVHVDAGRNCQAAAARLGDDKNSMLLETFAERQQRLVKLMDNCLDEADDEVRETWVQFVPNQGIEKRLQGIKSTEAPPEQVLQDYVELQSEVSEVASTVQRAPSAEHVKEFLESLANREYEEAKFSSEAILGKRDL